MSVRIGMRYLRAFSNPGGWLIAVGPLVVASTRDGHGWFRLFGHGLFIRDLTRLAEQYEPMSERYGWRSFREVGRWRIGRLTPI